MNARTHTLPWIAALLLFLVPATGIEAQVTPVECAGANLEIPTRYKAAKRIVAIGDLHGDLEAARAAFRLAGAIDENDQWIGGKLVVVQLGDQLDRGGDEIEILDFLDSLEVQAEAAGGRLIAMNGNHELMNVQLDMRYVTVEGFTDFLENPPADDSLVSPQQVVDGVGARILAMRPGGEVALRMSDRNVITIVGKTAFVHGGILPHVVEYGIERLNQETRSWMRGEVGCPPPVLFGSEGPVWSRHYSANPDEPDCLMLEGVLKSLKVKRLVVGHTVQKEGIASACEEHVWRIDVGMAEHYGGSPEVLEIKRNKIRRITAETEE